MQSLHVATLLVAAMNMLDIATGEDTSLPEERAIKIKTYEVVARAIRDMPQLGKVTPPKAIAAETAGLSRAQQEVLALQALIQRKQRGA